MIKSIWIDEAIKMINSLSIEEFEESLHEHSTHVSEEDWNELMKQKEFNEKEFIEAKKAYYDFGFHKTNRDQARSPKSKGKIWCEYCDAEMVHPGEKCSRCNKKDLNKNLKKESSAR